MHNLFQAAPDAAFDLDQPRAHHFFAELRDHLGPHHDVGDADKVYTMLSFPRLKFRHDVRWDEPEPDEELMAGSPWTASWEAARIEAFAKLDDRMPKESNRDADPPML